MSINIAATFNEAWAICRALDSSEADDRYTARALKEIRRELWHVYPGQCEDHIDQRADKTVQYPIGPLPADVQAANVAARESRN